MMETFSIASSEARLRWALLAGRGQRTALPDYLERDTTRFVFWARNAIFHGLAMLGIEPGQKVLVPAYHCAAIVETILAFGAKVVFYRVAADCAPDIADVTSKVDEQTRAVLAIHYFGFPAPLEGLQRLCKVHNLFLIEDCAHVITARTAGGQLGRQGHISVFSFRKFLPVYDGGCLVINATLAAAPMRLRPEGWALSAKVAKNLLERLSGDSNGPIARATRTLLDVSQTLARKLFARSIAGSSTLTLNVATPAFNPDLADLPMSRLSRRVLANSDLEHIVRRRRSNYRHLLQATAGMAGLKPLHPDLPDGICPWVFPVFSTGVTDLHKQLRARGVAAAAWDGVIHPSLPVQQFPDAARLYASLIFLPVHQDLTTQELDAMSDVLRELLSNVVLD